MKHIPPWNAETIDLLNVYQKCGFFHPYTCGHCRDTYGTRFVLFDGKLIPEIDYVGDKNISNMVFLDRELIPTEIGWKCETCDCVQEYCLEESLEIGKLIKTGKFWQIN